MKCFYLMFIALLGASFVDCFFKKYAEVQVPGGRIRGSVMNSRLSRQIYSFRGVRYARPPVRELRFQPPMPANNWEGVFDATEEGPACPQPLLILSPTEDCLRLNVYTTKLPQDGVEENVKRPVMVFIHPGAFSQFSGQSVIFGPQYLMDKDLVLVTFNYRLSTLGFISTGDSVAPGNLGLKDQVMALRWVQKNIAAFGGDPNSVTIVGASSGARSVILHMVSPMSKGLFHRAVSMGGSPLAPDGLPTEQTHLVKKQANLLDCPTDTTENMISCLKTRSAADFGKSAAKFAEWHGQPVLIWSPVVEPEVEGVERFLSAQPVDLIRQGKINRVPFICGVTENEFEGLIISFVKELQRGDNSSIQDLNDNWYKLAPINFVYERDTLRSISISESLRQFYFNDEPVSLENIVSLGHIYSDSLVLHRVHRTVQLMATYSKEPVYVYKYTHVGPKSLYMWNATTPYGASHQDELQYLFNIHVMMRGTGRSSIPMIVLMTSLWSNFIIDGQPTSCNSSITGVTWDQYLPSKDNYLEINLRPCMKTGLHTDRMQIWERLFPLTSLLNAEA